MSLTVDEILEEIPVVIQTGIPANIKSFNHRPLMLEIAKNLPRGRENIEAGKTYVMKAAVDIKNAGENLFYLVDLGDIYPVKETHYHQITYVDDNAIELPISATEIPYIIIENTVFQKETGAFTATFGVGSVNLTLTEGYALEGNKIMVVYK